MGVTAKARRINVGHTVLAERRKTPGRRWEHFGPPERDLIIRADGAWTRNVNGYDLAEIVCQPCVLDRHRECVVAEHVHTGYSCCACNGRVVIGAATAANGKENP